VGALKQLVLASTSKRRIEILREIGVDFLVIEPKYREIIIEKEPLRTVLNNAKNKGMSVLDASPSNSLILSADTVVVAEEGEILGKPDSLSTSISMLKKLNGRYHYVLTGICVIDKDSGSLECSHETTKVKFRKVSDEMIIQYASTLEGMDKAGSYAAQGLGALLIESIEGDFYNVIGLPIGLVYALLAKYGYDLFSNGIKSRIAAIKRG
jgi:septum formation protein